VGALLEPDRVRLMATTLAGEPCGAWQGPAGDGPDAAVEALRAGVDALLADLAAPWTRVKAVGVGVPALMAHDGRVAFAPNLGWRDVPLRGTARAPLVGPDRRRQRHEGRGPGGEAVRRRPRRPRLRRDRRPLRHRRRALPGPSPAAGRGRLRGRDRARHRRTGRPPLRLRRSRLPRGLPLGAGAPGPTARARRGGRGYEGAAAAAAAGDAATLALLDELGALLGGVLADLVDLLDPERVVLAGALTHVVPFLLPAIRARWRGRPWPPCGAAATSWPRRSGRTPSRWAGWRWRWRRCCRCRRGGSTRTSAAARRSRPGWW
jgi:hypothetical protein